MSSLQLAVIALLVAGVVAPALRLQPDRRVPRTLLALLAAGLLLLSLFPPAGAPGQLPRLLILGASWEQVGAVTESDDTVVFALPEAERVPAFAEPVPDLATALRRHPQSTTVTLRGLGLEARDRDAAQGRVTNFEPAPTPVGLQVLAAPAQVRVGEPIVITGRSAGDAAVAIRLRDPAGTIIDSSTLDDAGRFTVTTLARATGVIELTLERVDDEGSVLDALPFVVEVRSPAAPRVLLLAGAPSPETKYLRRWVEDAGMELDARIALGRGVVQGGPRLLPDAEALSRTDLAVVDARAWAMLGTAGRESLLEAVRTGMGLLLRLDMRPGAGPREPMQTLGWDLPADDGQRLLQLPGLEAELHRAALRLDHASAVPLLVDSNDLVLANWRPLGQGRLALWSLLDSYRIALGGAPTTHAGLWQDAVSTLARATADVSTPMAERRAWRHERVQLCGLDGGARVVDPSGTETRLLPDARACAAWWPDSIGLHRIESAGKHQWRYVHAPEAAPALHAADSQDATRRIMARPLRPPTAASMPPAPGAGWPWGLGFLLVMAALWWLERRRAPAAD